MTGKKKKTSYPRKHSQIGKLFFYGLGLILMFLLIRLDQTQSVINILLPFQILLAFIGGLLFTSFITTPLAIIIFYELGPIMNPVQMALVGGIGAMIVDITIVKTFQKFFNFLSITTPQHYIHQTKAFFKSTHLNIVALILGALIIMSPIPDELGLVLLGASKLSYAKLTLLLFVLNSLGIYIIALLSRSIL